MAADRPQDPPVHVSVDESGAGMRLDAFLAERFPQYSRVRLRRAIDGGSVQVDGSPTKAAYRLRAGQQVSLVLPKPERPGPEPENIPLRVIYEDDWLAAIDKPAGMVVHPSKGHGAGTLAAALAFHFERLSTLGGPARPGIVHRLDRDTSGVIVVAKTDTAHQTLAEQFERRSVEKEYFSIVAGVPDRDQDVIEQPIGIHPQQREKMAIRAGHATTREARTLYRVQRRFRGFAAVTVLPKTGRTHQIRLHLAHIGCPVLCDRLYGGRSTITLGEIASGRPDDRVLLERQALHARRLRLMHPETDQPIAFTAPLPEDIVRVLDQLEEHRSR